MYYNCIKAQKGKIKNTFTMYQLLLNEYQTVYCNILCASANKGDIKYFQKVFNSAVTFIYNLDMHTSITPFAKDCYFLPVKFRFKFDIMEFQILNTNKVKLCCPK